MVIYLLIFPVNKFRGLSTICVQEFSSQHLSSQQLFWSIFSEEIINEINSRKEFLC